MSTWQEMSLQCGNRFWYVLRRDESAVSFHADKVTVDNGCLCLWRASKYEGEDRPRTPFTEPELIYALAAGEWKTVWAASSLDGRALAVSHDSADLDQANAVRDRAVYG